MSRKEGNPKPQYEGIPAEKKTAAYSKAHYEKNKTERQRQGRLQAALYREKYPERVRLTKRNQWLSQNFKRTSEWYEETLVEQDGHCALCEALPAEDRRFQVDHDHACCPTDKTHRKTCGECIRGLLCEACNTELGSLEKFLSEITGPLVPKEGTWTFSALQYLKKYKPEPWNFTDDAKVTLALALAGPGASIGLTNIQAPSQY
jgi:hypothetical protein